MDTQISSALPVSRSSTPPPAVPPEQQEGNPRVEVVSVARSLSVPTEPVYPSDQKLYSQRALDRHQITVVDALANPGALWSGIKRCFSNVGVVLFPNLYLLPRYVPVIPLATSCYFGPVKATFGLALVGGVAGGAGLAYGWLSKAGELYNVPPLDNLNKSQQSLEQSWVWRANDFIKYSAERFKAEAEWLQVAPSGMKVSDPARLLIGKQDDFTVPSREASMGSLVSFCQQEVDSQKTKVQKLSEELEQLEECKSYHEKCEFDINHRTKEIEEKLLKYFEKHLEQAERKRRSFTTGKGETGGTYEGSANEVEPQTERQQPVTGVTQEVTISKEALKQELMPIYERFSAADMNFKREQHYIRDVQKRLAEATVDVEYMSWAIEQGMKTNITWRTSEEEADKLRNPSPPIDAAINTNTDDNTHLEPSQQDGTAEMVDKEPGDSVTPHLDPA